MQMKRCENGHYYDFIKHGSCPYCGVSLNYDIQKTCAKAPAGLELEKTQPLRNTAAADSGEQKTVGVISRSRGIDPVVGWVVCVEGPDKGKDFRIRCEKNFIGRSEKMDIAITGDETISRENHAIISFDMKKCIFRLYPGDSRGLVYLNGDEVISPVEVKPYDSIELGQSKLLFVPFCGEKFGW